MRDEAGHPAADHGPGRARVGAGEGAPAGALKGAPAGALKGAAAKGDWVGAAEGALLERVISITRLAGEAVLEVYSRARAARRKADGTPVTEADLRAQEIIVAGLQRAAPGVPVVAEEGFSPGHGERVPGRKFWLVDPLDGTKEFLSGNGEFTVNVALVADGSPVLGVVLAPARGRLFAGARGTGAIAESEGERRGIAARAVPAEGATVVSSRSHGDPRALARFTASRRVAASIAASSSLKFCLLACGEADLYPRFGRTMEWDTAAGDAVLRAAGGRVTDLEGQPLAYGKPGFENPHFVAWGRG